MTFLRMLVVCAVLLMLGNSVAERAIAQGAGGRASAIVVLVSRDLGLTDMSMGTLRRVYRGEPTEANGHRLIPFNYAPEDPLRRAFDLFALGMTGADMGRYWIDRRLRGQGLPPRIVQSQAMLRAVVARLPGAIGYITADQLDGSVRALKIDGKDYRDPGYPLPAPR